MSTEDDVRKASTQFYASLNRMVGGDSAVATALHPIRDRDIGWDTVKMSFEKVAQLGGIEHRVTNIYQREAGAWKIVHHHTDTSAAMLEILSRLQALES